ncbi:hypothetical protein NE237_024759 [Protea cynaroides]|uniref:Uncharacterized protein n=1 Tax=Protea cynaroides TaxID=273540 RepID=A0A9Q0K135_9MAGN|nr:hypothetical protein NE237_024759 [Protea cynaroides]
MTCPPSPSFKLNPNPNPKGNFDLSVPSCFEVLELVPDDFDLLPPCLNPLVNHPILPNPSLLSPSILTSSPTCMTCAFSMNPLPPSNPLLSVNQDVSVPSGNVVSSLLVDIGSPSRSVPLGDNFNPKQPPFLSQSPPDPSSTCNRAIALSVAHPVHGDPSLSHLSSVLGSACYADYNIPIGSSTLNGFADEVLSLHPSHCQSQKYHKVSPTSMSDIAFVDPWNGSSTVVFSSGQSLVSNQPSPLAIPPPLSFSGGAKGYQSEKGWYSRSKSPLSC